MAPSPVLDVKNGDRGGGGSYMYYAYILTSPPFAYSDFKSLTSHIYPPPSPTAVGLYYPRWIIAIKEPLETTQVDICTYTSPNLITKREIGLERSSYSCKLGSRSAAQRDTGRDMQMKWTTNTREGDATILGIWNLRRNHFRYLESAAGDTRKKEKGRKARISKKKKDNLSAVHDILKNIREFP